MMTSFLLVAGPRPRVAIRGRQSARLPRSRFHDLRHTAATLMLEQGTHPKVVAERLGHATVNVTLNVYPHVTATMQREAAAAWTGSSAVRA